MASDAVISLFSGAGGMSLGFARSGVKPSFGIDINRDACNTYQKNLNVESHCLDLSKESRELSILIGGIKDSFAVIGGPPCQGFSTAGMRSATDPRNRLIFNYFSIVSAVRPRWFLFENVEGLLTSKRGESVASLVRQFIDLGYWTRLEKINFAAYGLPQARKRVILIGNRLGLDFDFPAPTHSYNAGKHRKSGNLPASPSLNDAIAGLGHAASHLDDLVDYGSQQPANEYDRFMRIGNTNLSTSLHYSRVSSAFRAIFAELKPGQVMRDLPRRYWHKSYSKRAFRRVKDGVPTEKRGGPPTGIKRLYGELNSLTITSAASREFVHPTEDRPLTLREAARLQSFPDYYAFEGNSSSIATQIGNAVPPLMSELLAKHLCTLDGMSARTRVSKGKFSKPRLLGFHLTDATGMSPALLEAEKRLQELTGMQHDLELPLLVSSG